MKLQIKTLSPIHIGNGEKYNGLSYVANREKVLFYDSTKIIENITSKYSNRFMQWVEQRTFEIEKLEQQKRNEKNEQKRKDINRLLREAQRKLSIKEFIENAIQGVDVRNKFNNNFSYSVEAKTQVYNNVDIDCFLKQNNKPYIPGTEIKGAIRTAVAYKLLQKNDQWNWLKDNLIRFHSKFSNSFSILSTGSKKGKDFLTMMELKRIPQDEFYRLFGKRRGDEITQKINRGIDPKITVNRVKETLVKEAGKIKEEMQNILFRANEKDDAKYDLLKLLHISDSELKEPSESLFVSDLKTLNINRFFPVFQELCKKDQNFTCQGFYLDNKKIILDKLGFSSEQKQVISDIKNLFQCCYEFSNRLLDEELAYAHYPQAVKEKLKAIKQQNTQESPIIRIGKNEGYLSLTVGLLVKDKDKNLYNNILCHATKNTSYTGTFPKTRRIVNLGNNDTDTCGWVKLRLIA